MEKLIADLKGVLSRGIKSLAVVLLHSYTFPDHEEAVGRVAKEMGFTHVSLSSHVMPMVRVVPRGYTGKPLRYDHSYSITNYLYLIFFLLCPIIYSMCGCLPHTEYTTLYSDLLVRI